MNHIPANNVNVVTPPGTPPPGEAAQQHPVGGMGGFDIIQLNNEPNHLVNHNNHNINDGLQTPPPHQGVSQEPPNAVEAYHIARLQRAANRPPHGPIGSSLAVANQALQDAIFGAGERGGENRLPKVKTNFSDVGEEPKYNSLLGKRGRDNDDSDPPPPSMTVSA